MPILAVDQFGRIYQTSRDRDDGLGYESHASCAQNGDLTLGNANLRAEKNYQNRVLRDAEIQVAQDAIDKEKRMQQRRQVAQTRARNMAEEKLMDNEMYRNSLARRAVQMGCANDVGHLVMSGDPLTANGQRGWKGMDRDQQSIHHHMSGMGSDTSHKIDPVEARQAHMLELARQQIQREGRQQAKIRQDELAQDKLEKQIRTGQVRRDSAVVQAFTKNVYLHPLLRGR